MSILSMLSGRIEDARAAAGRAVGDPIAPGGGVRGPWGGDPARRIVPGAVERCPGVGEGRFSVALTGGRVYTVSVQSVPRGVHALISLYGPTGELIGCEAGWGRVRLVQAAPASGLYMIAAEIGSAGEAFVLRVLSWTPDEVARAVEDPLYVL